MSSQQTPQEIGSLSFGLMDPEEYREMSATKVITADTYDDDGFPIDMGLMDPRLGVIDPGLECKTCGKHSGSCNGHFGHIELAAPVIHVGFAKLIRRLLRGTCRECSRLCLDESERDEFRDRLQRTRDLGRDLNDVTKAAIRQARKKDTCPFCGEKQYDIKHEKPTTYYEVQQVLSADYPAHIAEAMEEADERITPTDLAEETGIDAGRVQEIISGDFRPREDDRRAIEKALSVDLTEEDMNKLMPSDIRDWFEDIPDEDIEVLGMNPDRSRPEWMILTVLPVPPVTARPSITLDNGQRSEDDLTHKLVDIIRINQRFMENREAGAPQLIIEDLWELLQYHVTTFMDNEISGTPPARHRSGRPLKTLSQRLKGKEGRFRGSLSGKRVNFSARTVISPDPTLSLNEVGVPERVAREMTQTMNVNERNLDKARRYVANGPMGHPGANYVRRPDGRRLKVTEKNCEELAEKVEAGWEVSRHLVDGDIIIFNRQPSLHRMSIMAHEVVVMPYKTFRLNTVVCPPYNADFDGDEMNMHALQNEEARAEARVLMRVQEQMLSPRFGENIIGAIQDHISGTYLLTHTNPQFNETQALDMLRATRIDELPEPDGTDEAGEPYWTGRSLFSELLPDDLNLDFTSSAGDNVVIEDGQMVSGTIDEDAVGAFGGEVVDTIAKDYSKTRARILVNEISALAMAESGARGSMLNLTQMAGCVGQQAVRGERINRGYENRTLSHFEENDLSSDAHGFVESSYRSGLGPKEFFFHAMGGREGLVDTAVRTSKSGYLQRRLINALSELETQYDGTVRDTSDTIVQFEFGEDGTSPVDVSSGEEGPAVDVDQIADSVLSEEFESEKQKESFLGQKTERTNLSEHADDWWMAEGDD